MPGRLRNLSPPMLLGPIALALCFLHLWFTPSTRMHHDLSVGNSYIEYIANHHALPKPDACWHCSHPPLYFVSAALVYEAAKQMGSANPFWAVTSLSFVFYMGFLFFAWRLIEESLTSYGSRMVATAIVFFWPLGYHMSRHINNDIPLMMAQVAMYYYALCWWKRSQDKDLIRAIIWAALAIHLKYTGLVSVTILTAIMACKYQKSGFNKMILWRRPIITAALIAGFVAVIPLAYNVYYYQYAKVHATDPVIFRFYNHPSMALSNHISHYLWFDLKSYIFEPFYNVYTDFGGRQFFWNALLKTSLFDEYQWRGIEIPLALSQIELIMIVYLLVGMFLMPHEQRRELGFYTGIVAFNIIALLVYRYLSPVACTQEYRYIYAITPLFAIMYAKAAEYYQQAGHERTARLGLVMVGYFALLSVIFIMVQHIDALIKIVR